ncbi:MAG: urease accessory protein UreD [Alphaproteobacteria bacterium]
MSNKNFADLRATAKASPRQGEARLRFERREGERTHLASNYAAYPFHVTRPLYFDAGWPELPTVLLQSASGGLFQGDRLTLEVSVGEGAAAHVTTQSATKVHSMERDRAVQATRLVVEAGGHAELLADASILFPDSHVETTTTLGLGAGASAIIAESFLWHDPKGGDAPSFALMAATVEASGADGRLLMLDRYRIGRPKDDAANLAFWRANKAQGALYAFGKAVGDEPLAEGLRAALAGLEGAYAGVSALPNAAGAYVRVLAADGSVVRAVQERAWRAARRLLTGRGARVSWRK